MSSDTSAAPERGAAPEEPPDRKLRTAFLAVAALWLIGSALIVPPIPGGDAGEYTMMTESLFRHLSPEMRAGDASALARAAEANRHPFALGDVRRGYFAAPDGRQYSYHFWGYSLLGLPARLLLQLPGGDRLRALPLTNAVLLLLALAAVLASPALTSFERVALFALSLLSPVAWYVAWPHPEIFTFALVSLALLWAEERRRRRAVLAAALAATQNPPLLFLVLVLWLEALWAARRSGPGGRFDRAAALFASAATLPVFLPAVFFYWHFGTPSLVARHATSWKALSAWKALELFLDLNIGMAPYLPITLALFVLAVAAARGGPGGSVRRNAAALAVMALACTTTLNWNHGMSGPSRYTIWMLPLVFVSVLSLGRRGSPEGRPHALVQTALAAAVLSQGVVVMARGGPFAVPDYLEHSYAATFLLNHAPRLYRPSHEIFASRTLHRWLAASTELTEPVVYKDGARCRKAWARPRDRERLLAACGSTPSTYDAFFASGSEDWRYVDY